MGNKANFKNPHLSNVDLNISQGSEQKTQASPFGQFSTKERSNEKFLPYQQAQHSENPDDFRLRNVPTNLIVQTPAFFEPAEDSSPDSPQDNNQK